MKMRRRTGGRGGVCDSRVLGLVKLPDEVRSSFKSVKGRIPRVMGVYMGMRGFWVGRQRGW